MIQLSDFRLIEKHAAAYIKTCQQREIAAYIFDIFLNKPNQWKEAMAAYQYYRQYFSKVKMPMIKKALKIFVLERCSASLMLIMQKDA